MPRFTRVAVIGGAGYVGSALVPYLVECGYQVKVIDLFLYGDQVLDGVRDPSRLTKVKADMRDEKMLHRELAGSQAVIHLACVSNDPSFDLDPALGKSINFDATPGMLRAVKAADVKRFIYASSSSVYGVKETPNVTEEASCEPLTDYSKYKLLSENLIKEQDWTTEWVILRPSTVCGYAPRLRLDLVVNLLTIQALAKKEITILGGKQLRPNIHIQDVIEAYRVMLEAPTEQVKGQTFNVGYQNMSVEDIAMAIKNQLADPSIALIRKPSNDNRSYHVNSDKVTRHTGFIAKRSVEDAIQGLKQAYDSGKIPDALTNPLYYNVKLMQGKSVDLRTAASEGSPA
jgi:nucleoside-diphosphate-sugar epimerase